MKRMNIIEYQSPTFANRMRRRREINEMARGVVPMDPVARALAEIAAAAVGCGLWVALCIAVGRWLLMM